MDKLLLPRDERGNFFVEVGERIRTLTTSSSCLSFFFFLSSPSTTATINHLHPPPQNTHSHRMKRNPRKVRWTKAFRKAAGKEMTIDSTLEFEKRRNIPVKYDRELVATTVAAVSRIQEIKAKRERAFYKNRMLASKPMSLRNDALEVLSGSHLLGRDKDSAIVRKAKQAAELKAIKKQRRREQQLTDKVEEMQQDLELEEEAAAAQEEDEAAAEGAKEKIKVKVPATKKKNRLASSSRSALMPAADGMQMGMQVD